MPLGLPTHSGPLYSAVLEALTRDQTGPSKPRALPMERIYKPGRPSDLSTSPRASEVYAGSAARGRPVCQLAPIELAPIEPTMIMSDRARYDATVSISCWYYAHDVDTAAWQPVREEVELDVALLVAALTYPGSLYADMSGRRTGLDGGCLDRARWSHRHVRWPRRDEPRVMQVIHTFRASCEFAAPYFAG